MISSPRIVLLLVVSGVLCGGCQVGITPAPAARATAPSPRRYAMRGEIVRLPPTDRAEITLRHEAVPDFVNAEGRDVVMKSMVMTLPLAAGASVRGLAAGDKVAFVLAVNWAEPSIGVERLERLPPETVLEFRETGRDAASAGIR